ncbi:hypothetical protein BJ741DRAFT_624474 [Chytriomyces cf. hyalinus JEL632]|nr:hypothetical protein BJ741DRAFT_624474 [Chytriomyces cf. hyalinus JEL632]
MWRCTGVISLINTFEILFGHSVTTSMFLHIRNKYTWKRRNHRCKFRCSDQCVSTCVSAVGTGAYTPFALLIHWAFEAEAAFSITLTLRTICLSSLEISS